ncbi:hypothetical protein BJ741DRAFT_611415 [Chytriomyces cf. hyalinus JEL632]|nr:hypothetical protein BJ741DRAFT_611415 [Chytriomyces cf. hyalinus JEL632]
MFSSAAITVLAAFIQTAWSHAILVSPTARDGMAVDVGIKYVGNITNYIPDPNFPPCANFPQGPVVQTFAAGSSIPVTWSNTIPHDSPPGVTLGLQLDPANNGPFTTLAQGVDDTLQAYSAQLPAGATSNAAVLFWMWQSMSDGGFYVGCSDIAITANGANLAPPTVAVQQVTGQQSAVQQAAAAAVPVAVAAAPAPAPAAPAPAPAAPAAPAAKAAKAKKSKKNKKQAKQTKQNFAQQLQQFAPAAGQR